MPDDGAQLGEWLDVDKFDAEGDPASPPDIFAVGFQEVSVAMDCSLVKQVVLY